MSLSSVCLTRNRNSIPYTDRHLSPQNVKTRYQVHSVFCPLDMGKFLRKIPGRHVRLSHIYMDVQAGSMCGVIPSLLHMSLNTLLKKKHGLFCIELYVNVIKIVGSFSYYFATS
jgi:hypothetical protein